MQYKLGFLQCGAYARANYFERHTHKTGPALINWHFCEEELPLTNQTILHIDLVLRVVHFAVPPFSKGVNNDPARAFAVADLEIFRGGFSFTKTIAIIVVLLLCFTNLSGNL